MHLTREESSRNPYPSHLHSSSGLYREILRDDHHVSFDAGTADDVPCAGRAQNWGVTTQHRKIRRSQTKVTSVLNLL